MGSTTDVNSNKVSHKHKFDPINYWTQLSTQQDTRCKVRFTRPLPSTHHESCSRQWLLSQAKQHTKTNPQHKHSHSHTKSSHISSAIFKQGIIDGTIPSAVSNTGATSTVGTLHTPFLQTDTPSTKVFMLPTRTTTTATTQPCLHLNVHEPSNTVDIVPSLHQTLLAVANLQMQTTIHLRQT